MAVQTEVPQWAPGAHTIGCAFVGEYYRNLHHNPDLLYRYYLDESSITRPDTNGVMNHASTLNDINELVCSLGYKKCKTKIKTVDAQASLNGGTIVLVTGILIEEDNRERNFMQTFFLASQGRGYYVLNDIFRFMDEVAAPQVAVEEVEVEVEAVTSEPAESVDTPAENHATSHTEEVEIVKEKAAERQPSDDEYVVVQSEPAVNGGESPVVAESVTSEISQVTSEVSQVTSEGSKEGTSKKSYASILTSGTAPPATLVDAPAPVKPTPAPEKKAVKPAEKAPAAKTSKGRVAEADVEGYSIFVRNLPMSMTPAGLEAEFMKFGAIKKNGVQVRSSADNFCFGFVEFVESSSRQNALKAKSMIIGDKKATFELKKTTTRVNAARGPNHNNGNFKGGNGNSNGGRGYSNGGRGYSNGSRGSSNGGRVYVKSDTLKTASP